MTQAETGPPGVPEKGEKEADHPEAGGARTRSHRKARATIVGRTEQTRGSDGALRGTPSNRKIEEEIRRQAVEILSREVYRGFGPALASEHLRYSHGIEAGKETVRQWMIDAKLWRPRLQQVENIHE